ncbi:LPXTG cell wall anchor domain-containing protein, partial [Streptococcus suis]|nr:LPXTG cell wall anchor domain-containing protein [Streptococcus suis]
TITRIGYNDAKTSGRFDLASATDPDANNPNDALLVNTDGYLTGNLIYGPGAKSTRRLEVTDNGGAKTTSDSFMVLGYTDKVSDTTAVGLEYGVRPTLTDITAKMAIDVNSSYPTAVSSDLVVPETQYTREVVGYRMVGSTDVTAVTSADQLPATGDYEVKVKTKNIYGQEIFNWVSVDHTDNTPPTVTINSTPTNVSIDSGSVPNAIFVFGTNQGTTEDINGATGTSPVADPTKATRKVAEISDADNDAIDSIVYHDTKNPRFDLASATDPDANNPNDALLVNQDGYLTGHLIYGPGAKSTRRLDVTDSRTATTNSDRFMVLGYTDKVSDTTAVGLEYGVRPTLTDITAKMAIDVNSSYPNAVPSTLVIPEDQYSREIVGYRIVGSTDVTAVTSADQLPATGDYEVKVKTKNIYGQEIFNWVSVDHADNTPPTVTINSTPTNVPIDSGSVPNAIFIFGTNQGTTEDINGATGTSPVADPTKATQKVAEMTDADGTITRIGYNDAKTSGRFDLASATDPDANNPNDALLVNTDGYLTGHLIYGPGAKSTRRLEVTDNGGAMTTSDTFMVLGYTDKVNDTTAVAKELGVRPTADDIYSKLAIDVNSSYPNAVPSTLVIPEDQYSREIVGYRIVGSTDVTAATSADQLPDIGNYEVRVKTTNIYGQEIYNWVSVTHPENIAPTVSQTIENQYVWKGTSLSPAIDVDVNDVNSTATRDDIKEVYFSSVESTNNIGNPGAVSIIKDENGNYLMSGTPEGEAGYTWNRRITAVDKQNATGQSNAFNINILDSNVISEITKPENSSVTAEEVLEQVEVLSRTVAPTKTHDITSQLAADGGVTKQILTDLSTLPKTGRQIVQVQLTSPSGHTKIEEVIINFTPIDSTAPEAPSVVANADGSVTVKPSQTDGDDTKTVDITYTDENGTPQKVTVTKADDGTWSVPADSGVTVDATTGAVTIPADKVKDSSPVTAVSKDEVGNTSTTSAATTPATTDNVTPVAPAVTEVTDPTNLTDAEKAKVKEEVEKSNPDLPTGTEVTVGNDGTVTVTYPDQSVDTIPGTDTVAKDSTAPEAPVVNAPKAGDTTVTGTTEPGATVTVTFPDGSTVTTTADEDGNYTVDVPAGVELKEGDKVTATATDEAGNTSTPTESTATANPSDADENTPNTPAVTPVEDPNNLTDAEKAKVKEEVKKSNPNLPTGTTVEVGNDGTVTVTYPDQSVDTIPGTDTVAKDSTAPEAPVVNAPKAGDTTVTGTTEPGATVTVTFPDGSTVTTTADEDGNYTVDVPAGVELKEGDKVTATATDEAGNTSTPTESTATANPSDADENTPNTPAVTPVEDPNNLTDAEKAKVKEEVEKANPDLPTGTTVEVGNDGTVTLTYPDGSVDTIPATDTVVSTTPTPQTDAEKNDLTNPTKTPVTDVNNLTDDEKAKVKEEVEKSNPDLPSGTTITVGNDGTATITYPDGSTDTLTGTVTVIGTTPTPQTDAEKNDLTNPTKTPVADVNNLTDDEKAKVKEEVEKSNPDLPSGTTITVGNDGTATITYPDGSTDTLTGTVTVIGTTPTPQTDAEKNDLANPTKTPVADTNNLTDDEKAKVKEEVEKTNPDLPTGTTITVGNDGTATITYPDGSVDTIPGTDTVATEPPYEPVPQTDAEKNGITNPTKTPVADTNNLTEDEKAKVKEEVEKSNPGLPSGTTIVVGNGGSVTITYPDGSIDIIPGADTVVTTTPVPQTDAEKNDVTNPAKTPVADTNNLTEEEKAKVKEEVEKSNPGLPSGTTIVVGNGGSVTITYPDGSIDIIPGADAVVPTTPTPQTDAEKNGITNPTKTPVADTNNLTEDEKAKVKEEVEKSNPGLPSGTTIVVGNGGSVTITYPDGSIDIIPAADTVVTTTPVPQTDAEENDVTNPAKTPVADTNNLTEDEKAKVKEEVEKSNPDLPSGTTIVVGNGGSVTITYPDGSIDIIPAADAVVPTTPTPQTDAEKNGITNPTKTPVADTNNLTEDEKAKVKEEVEKSNPGLPSGTTIEVSNGGSVTITYPDGSIDIIPAADAVVPTTPTPQTDAEKNGITTPTKTPVADTNKLTEEEKAKVKEEVEKSNPGLPTGTTIVVGNDGSVTITYPDGSVDTISGTDTVVSTTPTPQTDAEKNGITTPTKTPVGDTNNLTDEEKAKVKEEVENSNPALPIGTTVEVGNDGTVTITYPDGSIDIIPGADAVVPTTPTPQTDAEKNGITTPTKTPVSDTNNLTDAEKAKVKEEVEKSNPALPTGTTVEVGNDGTVTITYPDGSVDTISGTDTVVSTTPTPQTDAEKNDLTNPTKTPVGDTNNLTDAEKAKVKEEVEKSNPDLPTGTTITVGNDGTATITYPDGSTDTLTGTVTVIGTTSTPQTDAEKNDLTTPTKTPVSDTNNLTDEEKAKVKEEVEKSTPGLPTGTTITVGNDGTVTITYPDGSVDTISGTDTVTPNADTSAPVAPSVNVPNAGDKTVTGSAKPGSTVTVTFPDGSTVTTIADENGNFTVDVPAGVELKAGDKVTASATDKAGNVSASTVVTVISTGTVNEGAEEGNTEQNSEIASTGNTVNIISGAVKESANDNKQAVLPNTGEESGMMSLMGLAGLSALGLLGFKRRRKEEE